MRLCLPELQENDKEAKTLRDSVGVSEDWEDDEGVFQYQGLSYIPNIICSKIIIYHHNDSIAGHFGINKTRELISQKYYWPSLKKDVETYVRGCNVYLALKVVHHKPYSELQSLSIPTHRWKDLSIDFVTGLPLSADWKSNSYDLILVIID